MVHRCMVQGLRSSKPYAWILRMIQICAWVWVSDMRVLADQHYVCTYGYICVRTHQCTYICTYRCTYVYTYQGTYICTYPCTCIFTYGQYIFMYLHTCIFMSIHMYLCIYIYIYIYIHIYIYTYWCAYVCTCRCTPCQVVVFPGLCRSWNFCSSRKKSVVPVCMSVCIHKYTWTNTYIHKFMHTFMRMYVLVTDQAQKWACIFKNSLDA